MNRSRRVLLKRAGLLLAGAGLARCGAYTMLPDGGVEAVPDVDVGVTDTDAGLLSWAIGGTAAMLAKTSYPDPFTAQSTACAATCEMTLGPCYAASPEREDISEAYPGIPLRFALRLLDTDCNPLTNTRVDIWHCATTGLYSGDDASDFCTSGDADARAHRFFRGTQSTDAEGKVYFDTCFPGWYSGRSVHVHYRVVIGTDEYLVSQLFFPEDVVADIFATVEGYASRGQPDTTFATDNVLGGVDGSPYVMEVQRMTDGAMLASKTVFVRRALTDAVCSVGQGGGMGPPPGGDGGMGPPPGMP